MYRNGLTPQWNRGNVMMGPAFDRFLSRAFDVPVWGTDTDVQEFDDHAEIVMDVPGVKPEQIEITAEHRVLNIKVEREGHEAYTRQYTIGSKYDVNQANARLELGVLTVTLPKLPEAKARTIPISTAA
jgi:HSP20 family protein